MTNKVSMLVSKKYVFLDDLRYSPKRMISQMVQMSGDACQTIFYVIWQSKHKSYNKAQLQLKPCKDYHDSISCSKSGSLPTHELETVAKST